VRSISVLLLLSAICVGAWGLAAAHDRAPTFRVRAYPLLVRQPPPREWFVQGGVLVASVSPVTWREWERRGFFRSLADESDSTFGVSAAGAVQFGDNEVGVLVMVFSPEPRFTQLALDAVVCRDNGLVLWFSEWFDDPGVPNPSADIPAYAHRDYQSWLLVLPQDRLPFERPWAGQASSTFGLTTQFTQHRRARAQPPNWIEQNVSC
jgi:hypothetical protein